MFARWAALSASPMGQQCWWESSASITHDLCPLFSPSWLAHGVPGEDIFGVQGHDKCVDKIIVEGHIWAQKHLDFSDSKRNIPCASHPAVSHVLRTAPAAFFLEAAGGGRLKWSVARFAEHRDWRLRWPKISFDKQMPRRRLTGMYAGG